ncbi:MAG TPA: hypothetical protein VMX57_00330, partial [Planctomycetota bacterium]|nr:hypothetical protein [Planctomycetota bacterium]
MRIASCILMISVTMVPCAGVTGEDAVPTRTVVLDTAGSWRVFHVLAPPVVETADGLRPVLAVDQPWFQKRTPEPPVADPEQGRGDADPEQGRGVADPEQGRGDDWRTPAFDDAAWLRGPSRIACESSLVARVCLRGKFTVTDPDRVKDLRLTLAYYGGAIVY